MIRFNSTTNANITYIYANEYSGDDSSNSISEWLEDLGSGDQQVDIRIVEDGTPSNFIILRTTLNPWVEGAAGVANEFAIPCVHTASAGTSVPFSVDDMVTCSFGAVGQKGATGSQGSKGQKGASGGGGGGGDKGQKGATGAAGPTGPQGPSGTGPTGPQGAKGATGATGAAGAKGATGATGSTGPSGAKGATGATGPQGSGGSAGSKGQKGEAGAGGGGSGDAWSDAVDSDIVPGTDDTYDLGSGTHQFKDGYFDGTLEADSFSANGSTGASSGGFVVTGNPPDMFMMEFTSGIATTFANISDSTVKENISSYTASGLDFINNKVDLKQFNFKESYLTGKGIDTYGTPKNYMIGVIAQDAEAIDASYMELDVDGLKRPSQKYKMEYQAALVNAIKELSIKNDALEARIATLEAE